MSVPPVPVIRLAVIAVDSLVESVSATMSATAVTVMATVLLMADASPSLVDTVSVSLPL